MLVKELHLNFTNVHWKYINKWLKETNPAELVGINFKLKMVTKLFKVNYLQ